MRTKGVCFYGADVPTPDAPHLIVIISDPSPEGKSLVVPISSIKFNANSRYHYKNIPCKYYDDACVFEGNEIVDDNGRTVLSKPSFARYQWAFEIENKKILSKQLEGIYKYKCHITPTVLSNLQKGAKKTLELAPYLEKYFAYF